MKKCEQCDHAAYYSYPTYTDWGDSDVCPCCFWGEWNSDIPCEPYVKDYIE